MGGNFSRLYTRSTGGTISGPNDDAEFDNVINNFTPTGLDDYSANTAQMQSTADPYPGSVASLPTSLAGELERIRYVITQITGGSWWYLDPITALTSLYYGQLNQKSIVYANSPYTVLSTDCVILVDATNGAVTVTLPTAVGIGKKIYIIKKIDDSANAVTVATTGGQYIDEATTRVLSASRDYITVQSEGSNWAVIGGLIKVPSIADYTKATHDHSNAANGGAISAIPDGIVTNAKLGAGAVDAAKSSGLLGTWDTSKALGTIYQATTDVIINAHTSASTAGASDLTGKSDSSSSPTTVRDFDYQEGTSPAQRAHIHFVCKKNDYWRVVQSGSAVAVTINVIPLGS